MILKAKLKKAALVLLMPFCLAEYLSETGIAETLWDNFSKGTDIRDLEPEIKNSWEFVFDEPFQRFGINSNETQGKHLDSLICNTKNNKCLYKPKTINKDSSYMLSGFSKINNFSLDIIFKGKTEGEFSKLWERQKNFYFGGSKAEGFQPIEILSISKNKKIFTNFNEQLEINYMALLCEDFIVAVKPFGNMINPKEALNTVRKIVPTCDDPSIP